MGSRARVGLVAMLVVGLALSIAPDDPSTGGPSTIASAHRTLGARVIDPTIDTPDFIAPAPVGLVRPAHAAVAVLAPRAPSSPIARHDLLRVAPKTSPPLAPSFVA